MTWNNDLILALDKENNWTNNYVDNYAKCPIKNDIFDKHDESDSRYPNSLIVDLLTR